MVAEEDQGSDVLSLVGRPEWTVRPLANQSDTSGENRQMHTHDSVTKVLVLSNHQVLRGAVEICLAREFDVIRHDDSQEAFDNLRMLSPDVIVIDIDHLNMKDGHSAAKWLNDSHPGVSAIFMINFSDDNDTDIALSALVSGGSFALESMEGALQGIQSVVREMGPGKPESFVLGYRLKILTETRELAEAV